MKVLNLRCGHGHLFEGWFASEDDFLGQSGQGLIACPMCDDKSVARMPSAPRLNLSGAREAEPPRAEAAQPQSNDVVQTGDADVQAMLLQAVRHVLSKTEDVGTRFPEEARRIHYGEAEARGIRGQATPEQRAELVEEGIEVLPLPLPSGWKGHSH
jgi:hypothetical protein